MRKLTIIASLALVLTYVYRVVALFIDPGFIKLMEPYETIIFTTAFVIAFSGLARYFHSITKFTIEKLIYGVVILQIISSSFNFMTLFISSSSFESAAILHSIFLSFSFLITFVVLIMILTTKQGVNKLIKYFAIGLVFSFIMNIIWTIIFLILPLGIQYEYQELLWQIKNYMDLTYLVPYTILSIAFIKLNSNPVLEVTVETN